MEAEGRNPGRSYFGDRLTYFGDRLKEALIYSSFPRRRESMFLKYLDSRLRGNDGKEINQSFLSLSPMAKGEL